MITNIQIINNNTANFKATFYYHGKPFRVHFSTLHSINFVYTAGMRITVNSYGQIMNGDTELDEHNWYEEKLFMKFTQDEYVYEKYLAGKLLTTWTINGFMSTELFNQVLNAPIIPEPQTQSKSPTKRKRKKDEQTTSK
ncbi:hypothetical protein WKH01_12415 [Pantoea agglomerans]|uniref:hypothetical protein n=1 Tax=Enterobacter agglomerans TaxID=549 RepID=UPI003C7E51B0